MEGRRGEPAQPRMWTEPRPTNQAGGGGAAVADWEPWLWGGALVCGGYCVALCHRDSWSFSGSDSGQQL